MLQIFSPFCHQDSVFTSTYLHTYSSISLIKNKTHWSILNSWYDVLAPSVSNVCLCFLHCPAARSCVHWSRTTQPGNKGWPSSWSRWWPSWVWRAEDHTSQGALGKDPIRNRAVPERRPVPIFFIMRLPPSAFQRWWLLPWPFSASSSPKNIFLFSSSTLLHRLVYLKILEGWFGAEVGVSHSAMRGIPQLHHREASRGDCLKAGHIGILQSPCWKKRGKNIFMLPLRIYTDR